MKKIVTYFSVFLVCASCFKPEALATIKVSETVGLNRHLEYLHATIALNRPLSANELLKITNDHDGTSPPIQEIRLVSEGDTYEYDISFGLKISAKEDKRFHVTLEQNTFSAPPAQILLSEDKLGVENRFYKIHFSDSDDKRGGQISGIALKDFENQLLKRGHIAMHWAPNFSKGDSERYYNMEDLAPNSKNSITANGHRVIKNRAGISDSVPEIHVEGRYEFYADQPYFLFESTMTMNEDVTLNLLRNDEMTMDSLFTHVVYPKEKGGIEHLNLYNGELDGLERTPIADDADWVAFYNLDKGYGFGSIRLNYENKTLGGRPSPTHKPYTKISKATKNGRYWNRVLSDTIQVFPRGSRYYEKNAYLIFHVDEAQPEKELIAYRKRLINPLEVTVMAAIE